MLLFTVHIVGKFLNLLVREYFPKWFSLSGNIWSELVVDAHQWVGTTSHTRNS